MGKFLVQISIFNSNMRRELTINVKLAMLFVYLYYMKLDMLFS